MPPLVCTLCRSQLFNPTTFSRLLIASDDYDGFSNGGLIVTASKDSLQSSVKDHCGLCTLLLHLLHDVKSIQPNQELTFRIFAVSPSDQHTDISTLYVSSELTGTTSFSVFADTDDPAAEYITARRPEWRLDYPGTFDVVRQWMRTCDEEHESCRRTIIPEMPTRALDVGSTQSTPTELKLVETNGELESYATLSYCWGAAQPAMLTTENYEGYLKEIEAETLPRSIQDAIRVTREIGIRYLWIDSLCILQDSAIDQAKEISRMGEIYKDAAITIMAAGAETCNDGFLHRDASNTEEWSIPWISPQGPEGAINLQPSTTYNYDPELDPVNKRAWIYQERLLSTGLLIYPLTPHPIQWSCPTLLSSNGGTVPELEQTGLTRLPILYQSSKTVTEEEQISLWQIWNSVVTNYTTRSLTDPSDKLPAISGIAQRFQEIWGGEYYAGLWSHYFIRGLMWKRFAAKPEDRSFTELKERKYIAPSWSWASKQDRIIQSLTKSEIFVHEGFSVRSISTTPTIPGNSFGQILAGEMRVCGCLKIGIWSVRSQQLFNLLQSDNSEKVQVGTGQPDEDTWGPGKELDVTCLLILNPEKYENYVPCGLLLSQIDADKNVFERAGTLNLIDREWFEGAEVGEVVVV